ncbi:MAG TPA: CpsD/CapB family tyrosine-protein kinase [Desulfosporosinus sp.]|nr:CpsD/CapB family tyrosine-protein kinase [Desulfosporosinus sp.]
MVESLLTLMETKSPSSEDFRMLRADVRIANVKSLMITSTGPREGKSSTVANLAVSVAQSGKSVLVVDADMRKPTLHKMFGLENGEGLSVALNQDQDFLIYIRETSVPGLMLFTAGDVPSNPTELVGSERMKNLIEEASEQFDMVIFDTPSVMGVMDAVTLAMMVDGVVLVLAANEVNIEYAIKAKDLLDKVGAKIIGAVLNNMDMNASEYSYYNYYNDEGVPNQKRKFGRRKHCNE